MRILGIDPGLAIVGFGVVDYRASHFTTLAHGAILTPVKTEIVSRLELIERQMNELLDKFKPEQMAIEELFFNSNHTTAIPVAEARGVILLTAYKHGVEIFEYTPLQVKQAVVGYGRAEKKQVQQMVTKVLGLPEIPKPDDVADALAAAICHGYSGELRKKMFLMK